MSYEIYYSIREIKKTNYEVDTLFFGKQKIYDNKPIEYLKDYKECINYINNKKIKDCFIRKEIFTGGGSITKQWRIKHEK